jgi:ribonuclease PH
MPRRPAKLANCYVPLPLPKTTKSTKSSNGNEQAGQQQQQQQRIDHRCADEIRQLYLETSVISSASGSSLVEMGHTKILCEVHVSGGSSEDVSTGNLLCVVKYVPHIGINEVTQRSKQAISLSNNDTSQQQQQQQQQQSTISMGKLNSVTMIEESGLSQQLTTSLLPIIVLEKYPKCTIVVKCTILQNDGSLLSALILSSSLALLNANVHLYDIVTSCTVALMKQPDNNDDTNDDDNNNNNNNNTATSPSWKYLVDPTEEESMKAVSIICIAMTTTNKEVTLWSQSGRLSSTMASQSMELCKDGCRTYYKFIREKILAHAQETQAAGTAGAVQ